MGKSGHVAGKIAATLASTGTPAFFCTPRKPGTVTSHDHPRRCGAGAVQLGRDPGAVLLLPHLKRLAVPLIVMTGKTDSTLGVPRA